MIGKLCLDCDHYLNGICEVGWPGKDNCLHFEKKKTLCPFCMNLVVFSKEDSLKALERFDKAVNDKWVSRIQNKIDLLDTNEERLKQGITIFEAIAAQDVLKELLEENSKGK